MISEKHYKLFFPKWFKEYPLVKHFPPYIMLNAIIILNMSNCYNIDFVRVYCYTREFYCVGRECTKQQETTLA